MLSGATTFSGLLLVLTVAAIGVLHTAVPDHWVPITLMARQRGWSRRETARAALQAGTGHVATTVLIGLGVWAIGVAFAAPFGRIVDTIASIALVSFGLWIAFGAWREMRRGSGRSHRHGGLAHHHHDGEHHGHARGDADPVHGPERHLIDDGHGVGELSIHEEHAPPRFRFTGHGVDWVRAETIREGGARQSFTFVRRPGFWESQDEIPEPHGFDVVLTVGHGSHDHTHQVRFREHDHENGDHHSPQGDAEDDPLYAPSDGGTVVLARHAHAHRHGGMRHVHWHDHAADTAHEIPPEGFTAAPAHEHRHRSSGRTALLLILGSSPMVEGIPAFFAASRFGAGLLILMAVVFAASTIATYVALCVGSLAGLQRVRLGVLERYGELAAGALITSVGVVFWIWPLA